LFKLVISC